MINGKILIEKRLLKSLVGNLGTTQNWLKDYHNEYNEGDDQIDDQFIWNQEDIEEVEKLLQETKND